MEEKLFLFDIDGTLLNAHQVPRKAMRRVLLSKFHDFNYHDEYDFTGRTDWEIVEHLLEYAKVKIGNNKQLIHEIMNKYGNELERELSNNNPPFLYPGIIELVKHLNNTTSAYLGLVTGNVKSGAYIKLKITGLERYFPIGAFGDEAKNRDDLPLLAIKRAEEYYQINFTRENTWIIGDSIPDVRCAQSNNLRNLIVCTGWTSRKELERVKPEIILDNLADTEKVLNILFN